MIYVGVTYGPGGYDPAHPNDNIVQTIEDNGDGTGQLTVFGPDGAIEFVEQRTDLPLPEPEPVDELAELRATVDALLDLLEGA